MRITETISRAQKKKRACYFQSLKKRCEDELQELSLQDFTEHPLFSTVASLIAELQKESISHGKMLFYLRKAVTHPAYAHFKKDESQPLVRFLHNLCLASYTIPCLLEAYREIGDHLASLVSDKQVPLAELFLASLPAAKKAGLIDNDYTLQYAIKHPRMLISAVLSKSYGRFFSFIKKFDPKGFAGNVPGSFFEEKMIFSGKEVVSKTIYTPTPSLGEGVAPETMAMLQAMENRQRLAPELLKQQRFPYLAWVYVNLQDMTRSHEGERSRNLMRLTRQYPHSFRAITVTQDGGLYRYKASGCLREKMRADLLDEANFTVEGGPSGYCFPCRSLQEKEQWKKDLKLIIDIVDKNQSQVVFCELVTLAIVRYFQLRCAKELLQARPFASFLFTAACKESIDRGGKINALLLLGKGKKDSETVQTAFSCLHARALSVRSRLIKKERMEQLCSLLSVISHDELQQFFCKIDVLAGLSGSEIQEV